MPQPHFDNTVNCANARQKADAYVFLRVIWSRVPSTGRVLLFCGALPCDCYNVRADQCGLHCVQQASARSRRRRRRRRHRRHRRRHRSQRVSGAGRHVGKHRLVGEHRRVRRLEPQQLPRRPRRQAGAQGGAPARGAQLVLSARGLAGTQHHQRNTTSGDKRQIAAIMHLRHLKWLLIGQRRFCEVYQYGQWQSATNNAPSPQF